MTTQSYNNFWVPSVREDQASDCHCCWRAAAGPTPASQGDRQNVLAGRQRKDRITL